ncbi:phospholipid-binding protein, PBP family [Staphylothermus marinus F1]|uniref:Phospholipid-binding protein, PBP family n=1 Tax=Staphylothermus marinus (strain ATCC 43588 / DSM 3639 / JCM 9404 / F1) TaxID=399550 RepID=A3DL03_STAMF|nr:YbhB/YbcL family Raf kinase inhibitor-like protein [Staphylothermus marinus]ABN69313.1 phospholipid-binding protein, PBP family [Staphylothermus marinus F1]
MIFLRRKKNPLEIAKNEAEQVIEVSSPVFKHGERIPRKYTCEGEDVSPPLRFENTPDNTAELALIMYDPDAPVGIFYHWLLYDISPNTKELPENIPKEDETEHGVQGINDFGRVGYGGPCPPRGHGRHRYYFLVLALREETGLTAGARPSDVLEAVKGKIIGYGVLMGTYSR